ncbi:ras guanine nucleotide exchange factor domain-containing protein [Thamnidium elegans]|nr:ras guanine nucleotide exchange factor domain-containing protein [Thamnidium elegans]
MNSQREIVPIKSYNRLPLIPLSPLTQTSIEYAKALAQTTKSLSETTASDSSSSNIISLLNKDLCKERENLDRLTKDIQNVQSQFLPDLNSYEIAREIAHINCSLFRLVVLDQTWISNFDKRSNIVPLLDFHRYLSHSFAHQVIYSVEQEQEDQQKKAKKRKSLNNSNNMITQLIQIAYILLHVYRDFSGCTAILTSLQMPEVQRLETLWSQCPSKLLSTYKELVVILSPNNNYEAYHHHLWLHTARFLNASALKSQMIAVPFMHAHLTIIRKLIHTHSAVISPNKQTLVLSESGKKSFVSAIHVLEFCQQHLKIDPVDLEPANNKRLSTSKRSSTGLKLSISSCIELDKLHSNPSLYHWLVSRAYLNRSQLHHESLQVEPLAVGEIELEPEEEYDLYWYFFRHYHETEGPDENQPLVVEVQKILPTEIDVRQNIVDDLVIVAPDSSTKTDNQHVSSNVPKPLDTAIQNTDESIIEDDDNETDIIIEEEPNTMADLVIVDRPTTTTITECATKRKSTMDDLVETVNKPVTKPCLSPTAPEFIPKNYASTDDGIIIVTELSKTEEDEDEWKGYPIRERTMEGDDDDDDDDEIWKGYPNKEDEDDEEEVWKGYPVPQQQNSPRTIDLSTPSTPQEEQSNKNRFSNEEWKGYQKTSEEQENTTKTNVNKDYPISWDNNYNQLHAIGKAAAKKMQYSLSNTDNRKRLPSSFTPSAST